MKTVFLNGRFVREDEAKVSVFDRGFLYGDGLFDTLRIYGGQPFRWMQHWKRLETGAKFLKIKLPFSAPECRGVLKLLLEKNVMSEAVLRINLSRGVGTRGYSMKGAENSTFVMSLHETGLGNLNELGAVKLITSSFRVSKSDPVVALKTSCKLLQILARAEAEAKGAGEALLLNENGELAEGTGTNVFWIERGKVYTPPLGHGVLPGVTRAVVLELCRKLKLACAEKSAPPEQIRKAEGVFLTVSTLEILEAVFLDGKKLNRSPLTRRLAEAYRKLVMRETAL